MNCCGVHLVGSRQWQECIYIYICIYIYVYTMTNDTCTYVFTNDIYVHTRHNNLYRLAKWCPSYGHIQTNLHWHPFIFMHTHVRSHSIYTQHVYLVRHNNHKLNNFIPQSPHMSRWKPTHKYLHTYLGTPTHTIAYVRSWLSKTLN